METIKKSIVSWILLSILMLVIFISAFIILNDKNQINSLNLQNSNLNSVIETRDSLVNDMAGTFDEIEQSLTFINNKRGQLVLAQKEGNKSRKEMLVADIRLMNQMLEESSKKIEELEKKLKSSGLEIKSYKNKIAQLTQTISDQDESIKQLQAELEKRNYIITEKDAQLATLQKDIVQKNDSLTAKSKIIAENSQTIVEKDIEINKAFFAAGTHKELIEKGVLTNEGGFLGIGKNTSVKDGFNENYFTRVDIRNTNQFPLNVKKAKLVSEHPANSYRLVEENDKIAYLEIENPNEFWKLTKYVIVETKK
jgi:gas vesicle protein